MIPLHIADGCLYRCKFCSVKTGAHFRPRSRESITGQIETLKDFYSSNIQNLNALFIGNHEILPMFQEIKEKSNLPSYAYLIQRL